MEEGSVITQIFLPISLAFIMFSVGLELTVDDFKRVVVQPKDFIIGAISQIILLPLVAFLLLSVWDIQPALAVGVMIIAACPGGVTSNLLTYLARGDTALSVSLTAIISLLAVLTLPFTVGFSIHYFMDAARAIERSRFFGKTVADFQKNRLTPIAKELSDSGLSTSEVQKVINELGGMHERVTGIETHASSICFIPNLVHMI